MHYSGRTRRAHGRTGLVGLTVRLMGFGKHGRFCGCGGGWRGSHHCTVVAAGSGRCRRVSAHTGTRLARKPRSRLTDRTAAGHTAAGRTVAGRAAGHRTAAREGGSHFGCVEDMGFAAMDSLDREQESRIAGEGIDRTGCSCLTWWELAGQIGRIIDG